MNKPGLCSLYLDYSALPPLSITGAITINTKFLYLRTLYLTSIMKQNFFLSPSEDLAP